MVAVWQVAGRKESRVAEKWKPEHRSDAIPKSDTPFLWYFVSFINTDPPSSIFYCLLMIPAKIENSWESVWIFKDTLHMPGTDEFC